jgi:hypothetical protein
MKKLNNIRLLENIEPFNDLFFINCYYNSLFPILLYYKKSILPILINYVFSYNYKKELVNSSISSNYIPVKNSEEILSEIGIKLCVKVNNNNLIEDTIQSITHSKPVIADINCYYLPIRKEYLKNHLIHTILIYGFNNLEKTFNIIEQKYGDSLSYQKSIITYSDYESSYYGVSELNDKDKKLACYYQYSLLEGYNEDAVLDVNNSIKELRMNLQSKIQYIDLGLVMLKEFLDDSTTIFSESALKQNINNLVEGLNSIVNAKRVEYYKMEKALGSMHQLTIICANIEKKWSFIRSKCVKYLYSSNYKQSDFQDVIKKISEIYFDEINYFNILHTMNI